MFSGIKSAILASIKEVFGNAAEYTFPGPYLQSKLDFVDFVQATFDFNGHLRGDLHDELIADADKDGHIEIQRAVNIAWHYLLENDIFKNF